MEEQGTQTPGWEQAEGLRASASASRYYAFDEAFVREVLGKKLSKGTKKDLDDISAKTGITLKSCRRQVRAPAQLQPLHLAASSSWPVALPCWSLRSQWPGQSLHKPISERSFALLISSCYCCPLGWQ